MDFAFSQFRKRVRVLLSVALVLTALGTLNAIWPVTFDLQRRNWSVPAPTEQVWIVRSLLKDLARLAAFSARTDSDLWHEDAAEVTASAFAGARDWYHVRVRYGHGQTWETEIALQNGPWNPDSYIPFTRELLRRAGAGRVESLAAPSHYSPLVTLTTPRPEVLQQENTRISEWLTKSPLDPSAHEEAALLAATLGWRDSAGAFRDPRDLCQRATAHIIMARALRGNAETEVGAVAELFIGLAVKANADSAEQLRLLAARAVTAPELNPWIATAEMALGRNWHDVAAANNPTLLERIELFRAICRTEGTTKACIQLGSRPFEDVADWTRILYEFPFKPAEGRRFSHFALTFETDEAARIFPELEGKPLQSPEFAKALNSEMEPAVTGDGPANAKIVVLDAGLWGHYLQRHLCHVICRTGDHLRATAALPVTASAFYASMAVICRHLKLAPLAAVQANDPEFLETATPAIAQLVKQHPDWVSQTVWSNFMRQAAPAATRGLPTVAQWTGAAMRAQGE